MNFVALFVLLLFLFSGCAQNPPIPEVPAEAGLKVQQTPQITLNAAEEQNMGLTTDTVKVRTISNGTALTGHIQAETSLLAHIYPIVPGQAVQVLASVGQTIRQGQVLAVIRSDEIGQLEGDLLQALLQLDEELREAQVQLELSKSIYNREDQLFKAKVSAKSEVESASAQYRKDLAALGGLQDKRQAMIRTYQERLGLYGISPQAVLNVINHRHIDPYITVRSPKTGLLISRDINTGELAETSKELFQVADLNKVWITGDLFEKDILSVKKGQMVDIHLDSFPNVQFKGTVDLVGAILDPQARTLDIRIEVPNPNIVLKPNMFARMRILTGERTVLTIPKNALQQEGEHLYAYVQIAPHRYEERLVGINMTDDAYAEVLSGLQPGEQIVSQGSLALKGEMQKNNNQ